MGKEVWKLKQWTGLRKTKVILRLSGKLCGRGLEGFLLWDAVSGDSFLSSSPQSFSISHIDIFPSTAGTPHSQSSVPWASPSHPILSSVLFPQFPHFFHLLCNRHREGFLSSEKSQFSCISHPAHHMTSDQEKMGHLQMWGWDTISNLAVPAPSKYCDVFPAIATVLHTLIPPSDLATEGSEYTMWTLTAQIKKIQCIRN